VIYDKLTVKIYLKKKAIQVKKVFQKISCIKCIKIKYLITISTVNESFRKI